MAERRGRIPQDKNHRMREAILQYTARSHSSRVPTTQSTSGSNDGDGMKQVHTASELASKPVVNELSSLINFSGSSTSLPAFASTTRLGNHEAESIYIYTPFNVLSPIEIIIASTRILVQGSVDLVHLEESPAIKTFWLDVENTIYMLKTSQSPSAWHILRRTCEAFPPSAKMGPATLMRLFSTLSPSNLPPHFPTAVRILRHLGAVLKTQCAYRDTSRHLHRICEAILQDPTQAELFDKGLAELLQTLQQHPGCRTSRLHFDVQRRLVRIHRRASNYQKAHELCIQQVGFAGSYYGPHSREARAANRELAHIFTASGNPDESIRVLEDVVFGNEGNIAPLSLDDQTVWAFEDLAEHCERLGVVGASAVLLEQAHSIAVKLWERDCSAAVGIAEKIERVRGLPLGQEVWFGRTGRFVSLFGDEGGLMTHRSWNLHGV